MTDTDISQDGTAGASPQPDAEGFVRNPEIDYSGVDMSPEPGAEPPARGEDAAAPAVSAERTELHNAVVGDFRAAGVGAADIADFTVAFGEPGSEQFEANFQKVKHFAESHMTPALWSMLENYTNSDGVQVGYSTEVWLTALRLAEAAADRGSAALMDQAPTPANVTRSRALQDELDNLMNLMFADPEKYKRDSTQARINQLVTALEGDQPIVGRGGRVA